MATLNEDENLNPTGTPGQPGAPIASGSTAGSIGGGSGSTGQGGAGSKAPTSSGSYTNLMSYIGANQGNTNKMGQAAAGVVNQAGEEADKALGAYRTAATDTSASKAGPYVQTAAAPGAPIKGRTDAVPVGTGPKLARGSAEAHNYIADPTQLAEAQTATNAVGNVVGTQNSDTGKYSGGLVGLADKSQTGTQTLLQKAYQQPSYSAGENQLDSFLVGASHDGQTTLDNARLRWGNEGAKIDKIDNPQPAQPVKYPGISSVINQANGAAPPASNNVYAPAGYGNKKGVR